MNDIERLESRIEKLEAMLGQLLEKDGGSIVIDGSAFGTVILGNNCRLEFTNSSVGRIFNGVEDEVDELEDRLDSLSDMLDDIEVRIDDAEDRLEDMETP